MTTPPGSQSYCEYIYIYIYIPYKFVNTYSLYLYVFAAATRDGYGRECNGDGKCLSSTKDEGL